MRIAIAFLFLVPCLAFAGDRITQSNDNNVATAGDVVTGTGDNIAVAVPGLGDVDIADCLASTQWSVLIVARQGVKLNAWCAAAAYDRQGLHETAARLRCTIPDIRELFEDDQACIAGNTVAALIVEPGPELAPEPVEVEPPAMAGAHEDDDEQEEHDELAAALVQLRADFEREQQTRQRAARRAAQQREAERQEAAEFLERYQQAVEPPPATEETASAQRENQ